MNQKNQLIKGLINGLPIAIGYFSVSFAFGIFAIESGMSPFEALLLSMTCVTSAGQLAAVPIICAGGGLIELALSQLIINMRYGLMSISLSQKFDSGIHLLDRFLIAFMNTDEIFAVAVGQFGKVGKWYMYGLMSTPWLGWSAGTITGALAGNVLPAIVTASLGIAIYGMFIAIVVPVAKHSRAVLGCVLLSLLLSVIFYYIPILNRIPSGFTIIICGITASSVFALIAPIKEDVS